MYAIGQSAKGKTSGGLKQAYVLLKKRIKSGIKTAAPAGN